MIITEDTQKKSTHGTARGRFGAFAVTSNSDSEGKYRDSFIDEMKERVFGPELFVFDGSIKASPRQIFLQEE